MLRKFEDECPGQVLLLRYQLLRCLQEGSRDGRETGRKRRRVAREDSVGAASKVLKRDAGGPYRTMVAHGRAGLFQTACALTARTERGLATPAFLQDPGRTACWSFFKALRSSPSTICWL